MACEIQTKWMQSNKELDMTIEYAYKHGLWLL